MKSKVDTSRDFWSLFGVYTLLSGKNVMMSEVLTHYIIIKVKIFLRNVLGWEHW